MGGLAAADELQVALLGLAEAYAMGTFVMPPWTARAVGGEPLLLFVSCTIKVSTAGSDGFQTRPTHWFMEETQSSLRFQAADY